MVKTCLSKNHGFVIVFNANNESQSDFTFSKKGSFVEIIDFNNLPNGLLGITVKSINKVIVSNICQLEDGLHIADIKAQIDPEVDDQAVLAEYPEISSILSQLIKHPKISDLLHLTNIFPSITEMLTAKVTAPPSPILHLRNPQL